MQCGWIELWDRTTQLEFFRRSFFAENTGIFLERPVRIPCNNRISIVLLRYIFEAAGLSVAFRDRRRLTPNDH